MTSKATSSENPSVKSILAALAKRVPKSRHAEAQGFANAFYQRMGSDDAVQHGTDGWAALAADMLEFARTRKRGRANVRLFNPTLKEHGWESAHTVVQVVNDDMPFLVDSVTMALSERGIGVHVLGHPVMPITRDKAGKLAAVGGDAQALRDRDGHVLEPEQHQDRRHRPAVGEHADDRHRVHGHGQQRVQPAHRSSPPCVSLRRAGLELHPWRRALSRDRSLSRAERAPTRPAL